MRWQDQPCILGKKRRSRQVWKRAYGDPGKLFVLHWCNERLCRELSHLYLGTNKDNMQQAAREGRLVRSEETRQKMRDAWEKRPKVFSEEIRRRMSEGIRRRNEADPIAASQRARKNRLGRQYAVQAARSA